MDNIQKANIFSALSNPMRLDIVGLLLDGEKCVCEITQQLDYEQPHISKGLKILKNAGIIQARKEGLNVYYSLKLCCIKNILLCLDTKNVK